MHPTKFSLPEVFDLLLLGKKIQMRFPTHIAAQSFRTSLYRFKRRQEGQMEEVGIDFEKHSLAWDMSHRIDGDTFVSMQLKKREYTKYTIVSIDDDVEQDDNGTKKADIQAGVGTA